MYQDLLVPMITNVGQENVFKREILFVALEMSLEESLVEEGEVNVDAIGKNVLIVLLTGIVKEEEVVIAPIITNVLNADTIMIVDFDKHVVEVIVNIGSANLIPIAKATRNAEDGIAKIGNQALPIKQKIM